jgi:branched-subunit amino acid transport protein
MKIDYYFMNVLLLAIGTLFIRGSFIAFSNKMTITPKLKKLFTFIPAAIFPALIVPATFFHQGHIDWLFHKERFMVMLMALIASFFMRNTLFIISFGLILLYSVRYI